ncbi:hypothetical protein NEMBOFW57_010083 [Staphylotrichum longicolle]|uniref:Uncharacterized protein n=1 Tax=Staphylotrichum longicolle TaxID=669026 RepID=A0AAD4EQN3_9PEZI|nr:hypothetical protein NEMBOFW57_010083 [Staphylotrichum longicolle]
MNQELRVDQELLRRLSRWCRGEVDRRWEIMGMNAALRNRNYDAAIMQADRVFYPLRSLITGEVIPGFPQTIRAISLLDEDMANLILVHLGAQIRGTLEEKRDIICGCCGLLPTCFLSEFMAMEAAEAEEATDVREGLRWERCRCSRVTRIVREGYTDEELGARLQKRDIEFRCRCPNPVRR